MFNLTEKTLPTALNSKSNQMWVTLERYQTERRAQCIICSVSTYVSDTPLMQSSIPRSGIERLIISTHPFAKEFQVVIQFTHSKVLWYYIWTIRRRIPDVPNMINTKYDGTKNDLLHMMVSNIDLGSEFFYLIHEPGHSLTYSSLVNKQNSNSVNMMIISLVVTRFCVCRRPCEH